MEPMGDGVLNKDGSGRIQSKLSLPTHNHSSFSLLGKRKAINGRVDLSCSLVKNYTNFIKSHPPKRILFHENGEWNDFPQGLVDLVIEDFMMKKAVIEVCFNEMNLLLDFVYMVQVELISGYLKPMAWIDEAGSCYFPELSSLHAGVQQLCHNLLGRDYGESELSQAQELKLHIDIDINGLTNPNLKECVEESNVGSKRVKVEQKSIGDADESLYREKSTPKTDAKQPNAAENDKHIQLAAPAHQLLDIDSIQKLFHMAMKPFINVSLLGVENFVSNTLPMRYELFQKQVEIIDKYRGNANVRYAWFPCSRDTISNITSYGLWQGRNDQRIKYGSGVHLNAVNSAFQSSTYCEVDENDVHQMVFCRVILGNMEVLHPGSQQFHPSCENFDSGVDNLQNPSCYIIWNMNASSRIFPEFVVTFKMLSGAQDSAVPAENKLDNFGVTGQDPHGQCQIGHPSLKIGSSQKYQEAPGTGVSCSNSPKSPSMQFSLLFKEIERKISAEHMNLVYEHYGLFKSKKMSRDEFIVKLRSIVGDQLLKSTITSLQGKRCLPVLNNARLT